MIEIGPELAGTIKTCAAAIAFIGIAWAAYWGMRK